VVLLVAYCNAPSQQFPKIKVVFNNGIIIEGTKGAIEKDSLLFRLEGYRITYPLKDVHYVMAKKNLAQKLALGGGGGCAAFWLVVLLSTNYNEEWEARVELSAIGYVALFTLGGGVFGKLIDPWKIVYVAPGQSSMHGNSLRVFFSNKFGRSVCIGFCRSF